MKTEHESFYYASAVQIEKYIISTRSGFYTNCGMRNTGNALKSYIN